MKNIAILLILAISFTACSEAGKEEAESDSSAVVDSLSDEVMKIHDEIMPETSTILKLQKKVKAKMDTVQDPELKEKLAKMNEQLGEADEAMMSWMRQINLNFEETPADSAVLYLNKQMEAIKQVKKEMTEAIKEGNKMIEEGKDTTGNE